MSLTKTEIKNGHLQNKICKVVLRDIRQTAAMKSNRIRNKRKGSQFDDDNVRYKLNTKYFNSKNKTSLSKPKRSKNGKKKVTKPQGDDTVRYKLPTSHPINKINAQKTTSKPKIKVKFWSAKKYTNTNETPKHKIVKVRKTVSVFPSPLYSDELVPMVTVPDDLTVHLNEDEIRDLAEELSPVNTEINLTNSVVNKEKANMFNNTPKRKSRNSTTQTSPKTIKRRGTFDNSEAIVYSYDNELEFFSKYVVQKLRRMDTNQRIYSENLINTVLMLGQLGKLNGKYKVTDVQNDVQ